MFVFLTVCICKYVRMCFHVCICAVLFMCVYTRMSVCVYMHVLRIYTCVSVCMHIRIYVCTRVNTPVSICHYLVMSVYTHPFFCNVFLFYPILCVTKRWPVTQLRLRRRLVRAISLPCAFPLRLVSTNFGPSLFVVSYCSLH